MTPDPLAELLGYAQAARLADLLAKHGHWGGTVNDADLRRAATALHRDPGYASEKLRWVERWVPEPERAGLPSSAWVATEVS